jgi:Fur family ferric uptake transcriptional regulator
MCYQCDYVRLIEASGLSALPNRVQVIEAIGDSRAPLTAQEILDALQQSHNINRVTLYRILDLLVHYRLVERMSAGDRSYRYGLGESTNHPRHPHFYCTRCGHMECLEAASLDLDLAALKQATSSEVHRVEVRLDGICRQCLHRDAG